MSSARRSREPELLPLMQCNTARQRAYARARAQKILIFRSQQLGRLFPSPRDRSCSNGCSFNFRLPERIEKERLWAMRSRALKRTRPDRSTAATRFKKSVSVFLLLREREGERGRATYRKNSRDIPRARHLSTEPVDQDTVHSYRSRDRRRRAASPRAHSSNLSDTRWARPGPEIIARSEI